MKNSIVAVGERVIVYGVTYAEARVKELIWVEAEARWHIILDWGSFGTSRVYDTDQNKTWYRLDYAN